MSFARPRVHFTSSSPVSCTPPSSSCSPLPAGRARSSSSVSSSSSRRDLAAVQRSSSGRYVADCGGNDSGQLLSPLPRSHSRPLTVALRPSSSSSSGVSDLRAASASRPPTLPLSSRLAQPARSSSSGRPLLDVASLHTALPPHSTATRAPTRSSSRPTAPAAAAAAAVAAEQSACHSLPPSMPSGPQSALPALLPCSSPLSFAVVSCSASLLSHQQQQQQQSSQAPAARRSPLSARARPSRHSTDFSGRGDSDSGGDSDIDGGSGEDSAEVRVSPGGRAAAAAAALSSMRRVGFHARLQQLAPILTQRAQRPALSPSLDDTATSALSPSPSHSATLPLSSPYTAGPRTSQPSPSPSPQPLSPDTGGTVDYPSGARRPVGLTNLGNTVSHLQQPQYSPLAPPPHHDPITP